MANKENVLKGYKKTWVKTPTTYQMEATECGAASLSMVLGYFGAHIPLEQLRIDCGVSKDGCNAKNILRAGRKYGLICKGYSVSVEKLLKQKPPCIIHWNFNHFVVFEGVKNGHIYINDPGPGRRELTLEDIEDSFTGIMLTFEKGENFAPSKKKNTLFAMIQRRLKGQTGEIVWLLIAGLILVFPGMIIPVFSQIFIDDVLSGGNTDWIGALLAAMIATLLFQQFFTWLRSKVLQNLNIKMMLLSGYKFLDHMFKLPINFFEQRYAGDLVQRVGNNTNVNNFLSGELAETVLNVIVAIFYLILLLLYSPVLTLIGVAGVAITLGTSIYLSKSLESLSTKSQQDQGKLTGSVYSGLSVMNTLKATGTENEYVARILGNSARYADSEQTIGRTAQISQELPDAITKVFNILVLMVGGKLVIDGNITAGTLVAFSELLGSFTSPVNKLAGFMQKLQTLKADMARVEDIENYDISRQFKPNPDRVTFKDKLTGKVELKDVSFGYSVLKPPLITDFSFKLEPGKTIALVGSSGSGKSTVGKLISGLNDAWEGEVLFDDVPLRNIPENIYTMSVSTVSQDIFLFAGTVKENLTLWNNTVMDEDIVRAAKDACIHDTIIRHPGAYEYRLSEGGSNFSGGQRQRLEIARALINNPTVLVLDEATSALDPIVEKQVMDNIRRRGCTCIIIAHRLSTIRDCDEIIVMDQGHIVQRGTHDEMKAIEGPYHELIKTV